MRTYAYTCPTERSVGDTAAASTIAFVWVAGWGWSCWFFALELRNDEAILELRRWSRMK